MYKLDDIQYEINFVKSVIKYNQNDKNVLSVIPNRILIKLISEIERINNLQPVAWMYPVFHDHKMQFTTNATESENIEVHFDSHGSVFKVTPLYILNK